MTLRVLCITSSYPRHEGDIAGCFVKRWKEELERRGVQVKILAWQLDSGSSCVRRMMDTRVEEVRYAPRAWQVLFHGAGAPENLAQRPWLALLIPPAVGAMWWRTLQLVRREPPDLIVAHWLLPAGLIARHVAHLSQIPSLIVTHSGGIAALDMLPKNPLTRALARHLASGPMTFVSEQARARFARVCERSVATLPVLPMGFDAPRVPTSPQGVITRCERDGILLLGRAVEIKGGEDVIEALASTRCCRGPYGATLHIVGDGPARDAWLELARVRGVPAMAYGTLTGEARDAVIGRCRVAIFGSKRLVSGREEGLPVAFLECAAAGVVPLVAHVPASHPMLVDREAQVLDASREPAIWSRQIDALYERATEEALVEAQQRAVASLEWGGALGRMWFEEVLRAADC